MNQIFNLFLILTATIYPVFIIRPVFAASNQQQWWNKISGADPQADIAYAMDTAFDSNNNLITLGDFEAASLQVATTSGNAGTLDMADGGSRSGSFLVKYSSTGVLQWSVGMRSTTTYSPVVRIDSQDEIYVIICFGSGDLVITDSSGTETTIPGDSNEMSDSVLLKFDVDGLLLWSSNLTGQDDDFVYYLHLDSSDNAIITGYMGSAEMTVYQSDGSIATTMTLEGDYAGFLVKYNSAGEYLWSITQQDGWGSTISVDSHDNIAVGWGFDGLTITILDSAGDVQKTIAGHASDGRIMVVKYNSDGEFLWAAVMNSQNEYEEMYDISFDGNDDLIASGVYIGALGISDTSEQIKATLPTTSSNVFLVKYSSSGIYQWSAYMGVKTLNNIELRRLAINPLDNSILLTGYYHSTVFRIADKNGVVSKYTTTSKLRSGYGARYSTDGDVLPFIQVLGSSFAYIIGARFDNSGNLALTGEFDGTTPAISLCTDTSCSPISLVSDSILSLDAAYVMWLPESVLQYVSISVPDTSSSSSPPSPSSTTSSSTKTTATSKVAYAKPSNIISQDPADTGASNNNVLVFTAIGSFGAVAIVFAISLALYVTRRRSTESNMTTAIGMQSLGSTGSSYFLGSAYKVNEPQASSRTELSRPNITTSRQKLDSAKKATRESPYI